MTTTKRPDFYSEYARNKFGVSEEWSWFRLELVGPLERGASKALQATVVTGAVAPKKTRGKYAGDHDWKKRDRATELRFSVGVLDMDAFKEQWERDTGNCSNCGGEGQELWSWSATEGTKYRPCSRCNGSGNPPSPAASMAA